MATAIAALSAIVLAACGGSSSGGVDTQFRNVAAGQPAVGLYQGVTSTAVRFTDELGQTRIRTYATPILIEVGPALRSTVSGQAESNPFHFSVRPAAGIPEEGLYTLESAAVVFQGAERLAQYWRFTQSGSTFAGEMTLPQDLSSLPGNFIHLPPDPGGGFTVPVALPLAVGTRITGTMNPDQLSFRIEGNTSERRHPFVSEVFATRLRGPQATTGQSRIFHQNAE